ncbi:MAG TPA: sugar phosphate isomerase/epimerase [Candidatus Brocadiia bacterium]|nr:sugar phosphate isomerase/epimerase [Candidatus Brocadiia bacterium]
MSKIPLGIQLYTVREAIKTDFRGVIRELAHMGYKGVEFAGIYGGMAPAELAAFLKEVGLKTCGLHLSKDGLADPKNECWAYVAALQSPFVTTSLQSLVQNDLDAAVAACNLAGQNAAAKGVTFTYHNHAGEFVKINGQYALDLLYQRTDPAKVKGELDTYWIKKGGEDPVPYLLKYAGRVPQIHLKDMNPANQDFTEVGEGLMDLPAIFDAAAKMGVKWIIYEQDKCAGPALESARKSITNLKKLGLV